MSKHYSYDDEALGVTLYSPDTKDTVHLQMGDDSQAFLDEVEKLDKVWRDLSPMFDVSPNPSCFPTYEDHLDAIISPYF